MPIKTIASQAISALVAAALLAVGIWLWDLVSEGGLVRALGGITEQELQDPQWREALRGQKGERGEWGGRGEQGAQGPRGLADSLPVGAVVAFNLPTGCPKDEGWHDFTDGAGRFIAGMGRHTDIDRYGNPVEALVRGQVGGHRTHELTVSEMPSHSHTYEFSSGTSSPAKVDNTPSEFGAKDRKPQTGTTGDGAPHNNMPPYIALHYCIYVGQ